MQGRIYDVACVTNTIDNYSSTEYEERALSGDLENVSMMAELKWIKLLLHAVEEADSEGSIQV